MSLRKNLILRRASDVSRMTASKDARPRSSGSSPSPGSARRQELCDLGLDRGAFEEVGVHAGVEHDGIREHEFLELGVVEELVLVELVGFLEHGGHVGDVPMADIGAEHRLELGAERVEAAVEAQRDQRVVGLAAEIEMGLEERAQILGGAQA